MEPPKPSCYSSSNLSSFSGETSTAALVHFLDDAESGLTACARDTFSELYETEGSRLAYRAGNSRVDRVYRAHPVCQKLAAVGELSRLSGGEDHEELARHLQMECHMRRIVNINRTRPGGLKELGWSHKP